MEGNLRTYTDGTCHSSNSCAPMGVLKVLARPEGQM